SLAGEDDDADRGILARVLEGPRELDDGSGAKRIAHLRPRDRELCDARLRRRGLLVADVLELARETVGDWVPCGGHAATATASLCAWWSRLGSRERRRREAGTWRSTLRAGAGPTASCWPRPRREPPSCELAAPS